jgi:uncharacterized protein
MLLRTLLMAKTALALTREEWRRYQPVKELTRRRLPEQAQERRRRAAAWRVAQEAANLLYSSFAAARVVLFGSLAHEDSWFTAWSDIDLAAWGIPEERFYTAVGLLAELNPDFKIDLVDPESSSPTLRQTDGILL